MKPLALLLGASLVLNTVLLATLALKPELAPTAWQSLLGHPTSVSPGQASAAAAPADASRAANRPAKPGWPAFDTNDLKVLVVRLREAGYPPEIIRAIIAARVDEKLLDRSRAIMAKTRPKEYWKPRQFGAEIVGELQALNRERGRLVRSLVAEEIAVSAEATLEQRRKYGSLPAAKVELLRRIEDDYTDMEGELNASFQNIVLPEDREKLALLQREKHADLASVLAPGELAEYELRNSHVTQMLRGAMTVMNATEAEFRAIHASYLPHAEVLYTRDANPGPEGMRRRQEALENALAGVKQALGAERYAEFERASDREFQQMRRLTLQGNLPLDNAVQAYALRGRIAAESERIADAKDLGDEQKRAALKTLAQNARVQLNTLLGKDSYANTVVWLQAMENGASVRFGPQGGVSLRQVGLHRSPRF